MSKVMGYRINIQKSILFPYSCNEQSETDFNKTIPVTKELKRIK
jgi:hypothetical protein